MFIRVELFHCYLLSFDECTPDFYFLSCMIQCIFLLDIILEILLSSAIICILCEAIKHAFHKIDLKIETLKIILIRVN